MSRSGREVRVCGDAGALATAAREEWLGQARAAIGERGRFIVALSGGSTPHALYASLEPRDLPWDRVEVFFGDERCVPPDHEDSNYRMVREALLSRVPIPHASIHRICGEMEDPEDAAAEYEADLRRSFGLGEGDWPHFDLALLGLGADGHTASLFPGSRALRERVRLVAATDDAKSGLRRITLTPPVFESARCAMFLVSGEGKAEALRAALEGPRDPERVPAQIIEPRGGRLLWLVDAAAARRLSP